MRTSTKQRNQTECSGYYQSSSWLSRLLSVLLMRLLGAATHTWVWGENPAWYDEFGEVNIGCGSWNFIVNCAGQPGYTISYPEHTGYRNANAVIVTANKKSYFIADQRRVIKNLFTQCGKVLVRLKSRCSQRSAFAG